MGRTYIVGPTDWLLCSTVCVCSTLCVLLHVLYSLEASAGKVWSLMARSVARRPKVGSIIGRIAATMQATHNATQNSKKTSSTLKSWREFNVLPLMTSCILSLSLSRSFARSLALLARQSVADPLERNEAFRKRMESELQFEHSIDLLL